MFLKLTSLYPTIGTHLLVNCGTIDCVVVAEVDGEPITRICCSGDEESYLDVQESFAEVENMISATVGVRSES